MRALYSRWFARVTEAVLAEACKFGLCLTMAHQSLKQLDDKLVSLILGNAQTQVYFRVSRQDAERLSKESANIVEQLYEREDHLIQEPEYRFTLFELWEVAFHNLAQLKPREAYVMVKGVMEHPEMIRTLDNPIKPPIEYPFDEQYASLTWLRQAHSKKRLELEERIKAFIARDEPSAEATPKPPADLGFMDER